MALWPFATHQEVQGNHAEWKDDTNKTFRKQRKADEKIKREEQHDWVHAQSRIHDIRRSLAAESGSVPKMPHEKARKSAGQSHRHDAVKTGRAGKSDDAETGQKRKYTPSTQGARF